ncbi:hypothetical protein K402DRAFT_400783 [Aulographum hederae CBS 113979]|uniref:RecA family profile 1 domain-containing protein n=1 Tax=Aulographum hederae CBS 113979 TaxID=1176131 RepID=A0A6G1HBI5_9PEZI|nr:hypothetical protein K402DRAFT_400783 [Aulographum hederae CBS 113979]
MPSITTRRVRIAAERQLQPSEAALNTQRLSQLLDTHPSLSSISSSDGPSLSKILSIQTPDLESQEHILQYQLPVAIQRHNVGLVVIDSIAANYRAELDRSGNGFKNEQRAGGKAMAERRSQLQSTGALLRQLAVKENIAIVVANQVADRFVPRSTAPSRSTSYNEPQSQSQGSVSAPVMGSLTNGITSSILSPDPLSLDHQQRWFTGWGDNPGPDGSDNSQTFKTPSLGLIWANQIACRIALVREPVYPTAIYDGREREVRRWRRSLRVVLAPWAPATVGNGTEFEITGKGVKSVVQVIDIEQNQNGKQ